MKNILAIRFSSIGDVALTVPVLTSLAEAHPEYNITVLSQSRFAPFFEFAPSNVTFHGVDLKKYKGICGIWRLYKEISDQRKYNAVADLHGVLRTFILDFFFRIHFVKVSRIDKERCKRHKLVRFHNKKLQQLLPATEKYRKVFKKINIDFPISFSSIYPERKGDFRLIESVTGSKECKWIGIAPFAAHKGKILPYTTMEKVIASLSEKGYKIFIFAFGQKELEVALPWCEKFPNTSIVGKEMGGLKGELNLISHLDLLIGMDSSNMHLASCVGTPVVSIWGATHPFAGFLGYGQLPENIIQENMPCRPCSIFGKKPCKYSDYRCMERIKAETIVRKVESILIH